MSNLLISEAPLVVLPSLAEAIGLNEALVLQQIHFWVAQSQQEYDGYKWFYRTDADWMVEFKFWSDSTLRRAVKNLKKMNLIRVEKLSRHFGGNSFDQKKYYSIDYSAVSALELGSRSCASGQSDQMEPVKPSEPSNKASSQNDQIEPVSAAETSESASGQSDQMESVNLNNPSSQNDQIRASQSDQIRTSQIDQMFTENKQRINRDGDGVGVNYPSKTESTTADTHEHSVFKTDVNLQSAAQLKAKQDRFQMHFEWLPRDTFFERCKSQQVCIDQLTDDEQQAILAEFRSFWEGRGDINSQGSWEHKLINQVQRVLAKKQTELIQKQSGRQAVTSSVMDVRNTDW
ncbi:DnaT-like ssDNA-binding domain-containing protein [Neptuniibacter sp.]|uniref:DnaT-like ssDNA-binding domain-containing protein n=1 Tax=Neptuniibacter sp. TaxID=1962643 RepID=UPI0026209C82|nr:DnaT-like ssDNA-binding domain-containing protein [Neptuniibacter sp.]MCP4597769.1 hypothetical protein [Neptuniibacter sp.]